MEGVGGKGREGGQTGALQLSGSAQSGVGAPCQELSIHPMSKGFTHLNESRALPGPSSMMNKGGEEYRKRGVQRK